jgi:hypothetical protein
MLIQKVQDAGVLPGFDLQGAARGVTLIQGGRQDSLVFPQEMTQVNPTKIRELYRPLKWRGIIPVESVATWANRIEDRKIASLMEDPVNLNNKSPTQELPLPALSQGNQFLPLFSFGLAYAYTDDDIELAAHLGIGLGTENIVACQIATENFLEKVASTGHTATGMKGLGNLGDVTSVTAVTKAATGTTWAVATQAELVEDLHRLCNGVQTASKENAEADTIVMPLAQYQILVKVGSTQLERSALTRFREERPGVTIKIWDKLSNQGSGLTPCAMAWDSRDPFGPRMLMKRELTFGTPLRGTNGWLIPGKVALGGVRAINPTAVCKMSGL